MAKNRKVKKLNFIPDFSKYIYYIKSGDVYRSKRKEKGTSRKVMNANITRKKGYGYYVAKDGIYEMKLKNQ